jgi:hypothetical protein
MLFAKISMLICANQHLILSFSSATRHSNRMKKLLLLAISTLAVAANAALSIGPTYTFDALPLPADGWTTASFGTDAATIGTADALDAAVNAAVDAAAVTTALGQSGTVPPSTFGIARWNSAGMYIQTRPTGNDYLVLMATVVNDTGGELSGLMMTYDWGQQRADAFEQIPGHRVYFSLTGQPGTWTLVPELSNFPLGTPNQNVSVTLPLGSWPANGTVYILWADDNADGGVGDGAYSIDNLVFAPGSATVPLRALLTSPANNTVVFSPATVNLAASTSGTDPATSVSFFTNDVLAATVTTPPFTAQLLNLAAGTYSVYAVAQNATETAYSSTNVVIVRDEFVVYTGVTLTETFDSMGTNTPTGWYVGAALPANGVFVSVSDGADGASGSVLGWNYGLPADTDRSLGTAPTGSDRNMVVRIQNGTGSDISAVEVRFDGEVWRNYTNTVGGFLTNFVSTDRGTNWVATGFVFEQPAALRVEPQGAVNGNDPANRQASIGGVIPLPSIVPPGGVIYIRWQDFNDGGVTDGGLAIDNFTFVAASVQLINITAPAEGSTYPEGYPINVAIAAVMQNPVQSVSLFADGVLVGSDTTAPYNIGYSNGLIGAHSLTATATDTLNNTVTTITPVNVNIVANVLPTITITNPAPNTEYYVGTTISAVGAEAADGDAVNGGIRRVEFWVNGVFLTSDTTIPYSFDLANPTAGINTISAIAVDTSNARVTSSITVIVTNEPNVSLIITNGSTWKYLDNGSDQGVAWQALAFNDAGWSNGIGELGYGDGPGRPERTVVSFGLDSTNKYVTTYFRKTFTVGNPADYTNLIARMLRDDGAVVYINGTEVWRSHMTNGTFNYLTLAGPAGNGGAVADDGNVYQVTNISPSVLIAGQNIIAVEIHQEGRDSSDISFDFMLWGQAGGPSGPKLTIVQTSPTQVTISWGADAAGYSLQRNSDVGNPAGWTTIQGPLTGAGSTVVNTSSGPMNFYRLIQ